MAPSPLRQALPDARALMRSLGALGLIASLVACSEAPVRVPERVAYPRGAPVEEEQEIDGIEIGAPDVEAILPADPVNEGLFAPVRAALARGDWMAAQLALPLTPASGNLSSEGQTPSSGDTSQAAPTATELWISYYKARIAHLSGEIPVYIDSLAGLLQRPLPADLASELSAHRLAVAELSGDALTQFREAQRLIALGGHPDRSIEDCRRSLWQAAQRLVVEDSKLASLDREPAARAWLDLARAAQGTSAQVSASEASSWLATYPGHEAVDIAESILSASTRDSASAQLALTVPLSGSLAAAGDAVTRGFLAAYYADTNRDATIDVLDSRRYDDIGEAIADARDRGASVIVGPLGKRQVAGMISTSGNNAPVLALNRPEQAAAAANVLQMSLAPEDEAEQLAELAFIDGARRVLLIRPEGVWGDRIADALGARWQDLGGALPATAQFSNPSGYSNAIRDALALDASNQRSAELRGLFRDGVETTGRRRQDLDAVFLLTRSGDEARALKPLIDYHYAGDLPVYALSTADSGGRDRNRDRDLEGLRLLAMPWRLAAGSVPGLDGQAGGSFDALHALGADAYSLAQHWWRLEGKAHPMYSGLTAELQRDNNGVLRRRLVAAEFNRGVLEAR